MDDDTSLAVPDALDHDAVSAQQPGGNRSRRAFLGSSSAPLLSAAALSVLATVPGWWRRRALTAGLRPDSPGMELEESIAAALPDDLQVPTDIAPREDLLDASPSALADEYVTALDESVRITGGRHYTPPQLATALYSQAISALGEEPCGLVWDPACGAGSLLLPALRQWIAANRAMEPELILATVSSVVGGTDIDPVGVWLGNVLLAAELLPAWARVSARHRRPIPALLRVGDGLRQPSNEPLVVVLNPPYGRVRLSDEDRRRWAHVVYGHANRYGLFMAAAVDHVVASGVVSALVPAGWLGGSYFRRLRDHLGQTAPLTRLSYVSDRSGVFATGVLQETVIATFRKEVPSAAASCERIFVNGASFSERIGAVPSPIDPGVPWLLPRSAADIPLVAAARSMSHRLADYGWTVSTGPLVWNRRKSDLSSSPRPGALKVLWAVDLDGDRIRQDPSRDEFRYIKIDSARDASLVLSRPAVLVQRTTAPEQSRRLLVTILDSDTLAAWGGRVVVENHVNVLTSSYPQSSLSPELLAAVLGSEAVDRLFRCLNGSVAVSAYELSALPLPSPETLESWAALGSADLQAAISLRYHFSGAPKNGRDAAASPAS